MVPDTSRVPSLAELSNTPTASREHHDYTFTQPNEHEYGDDMDDMDFDAPQQEEKKVKKKKKAKKKKKKEDESRRNAAIPDRNEVP